MSLKRDYRGYAKLNSGPGGWHCACCNKYSKHPRKMKRLARRLTRRVAKQVLTSKE